MNKIKLLVGISGRAGVGKDRITDMVKKSLTNDHGLRVGSFAFADRLKETASVLFGVPLEYFYDRSLKESVIPYWDMSPRQMLQKLGTDVCRNHISDTIWLKALSQTIIKEDVDIAFITDVRFDNEAMFIINDAYDQLSDHDNPHKLKPGIVVTITRQTDEFISDSTHVSEHGISKNLVDASIENVTGNPFMAAGELQDIVLKTWKQLYSENER